MRPREGASNASRCLPSRSKGSISSSCGVVWCGVVCGGGRMPGGHRGQQRRLNRHPTYIQLQHPHLHPLLPSHPHPHPQPYSNLNPHHPHPHPRTPARQPPLTSPLRSVKASITSPACASSTSHTTSSRGSSRWPAAGAGRGGVGTGKVWWWGGAGSENKKRWCSVCAVCVCVCGGRGAPLGSGAAGQAWGVPGAQQAPPSGRNCGSRPHHQASQAARGVPPRSPSSCRSTTRGGDTDSSKPSRRMFSACVCGRGCGRVGLGGGRAAAGGGACADHPATPHPQRAFPAAATHTHTHTHAAVWTVWRTYEQPQLQLSSCLHLEALPAAALHGHHPQRNVRLRLGLRG